MKKTLKNILIAAATVTGGVIIAKLFYKNYKIEREKLSKIESKSDEDENNEEEEENTKRGVRSITKRNLEAEKKDPFVRKVFRELCFDPSFDVNFLNLDEGLKAEEGLIVARQVSDVFDVLIEIPKNTVQGSARNSRGVSVTVYDLKCLYDKEVSNLQRNILRLIPITYHGLRPYCAISWANKNEEPDAETGEKPRHYMFGELLGVDQQRYKDARSLQATLANIWDYIDESGPYDCPELEDEEREDFKIDDVFYMYKLSFPISTRCADGTQLVGITPALGKKIIKYLFNDMESTIKDRMGNERPIPEPEHIIFQDAVFDEDKENLDFLEMVDNPETGERIVQEVPVEI